jgi:15-cis-phytoene synthase
MSDAFAYCAERVREGNKDRYLAALFAPPERRPLLYALYAADLEIAAIPSRVREPMAGELRLQWWREVVEGARRQEATASPVAAALIETLGQTPDVRGYLLSQIDGRASDLYAHPTETISELEAYAETTEGQVLRAACAVLGNDWFGDDEVFKHAACGLTFTRVLLEFCRDAACGKLRLPTDILTRHGVQPADVLAGRDSEQLRKALGDFAELARSHAARATELMGTVSVQARPAFLPLALVPLYLTMLGASRQSPFVPPPEASQLRRQWTLWRAARRWLK